MKKFFKNYLKYIILALCFLSVFLAVGIINIKRIEDVESQQSSYTRTTFDYFISSPDHAQATEIENYNSVEKVFAYFAFKNAFSGSGAKDVFLLLSDDMDDVNISVFTEKTLVKGEYSKDGVMLDLLAAQTFGVGVGDTLSFTVMQKKITKKVSGIYLTSTYGVLDKGVVLASVPEELSSYCSSTAYAGAFVLSKSEDIESDLKDYVGEGLMLSYENYVKINHPTKQPGKTQEQWDEYCREQYESYRADIIASAKRGGAQFVSKADGYDLIKDKIQTLQKRTNTLTILTSVAAVVMFIIANVVFTVTNRKNDKILLDEGISFKGMFAKNSLPTAICAVAAAILSFAALVTCAALTYFFAECVWVLVFLPVSVIAGCAITLVFYLIYYKAMYKNTVKL